MPAKAKGEIILYKTPEGDTEIDVKLEEETVWLTSSSNGSTYSKVTKQNVSLHINNIFKEGELLKNSVVEDFEYLTNGKKSIKLDRIKYYNLDVIISVGYRVKSKRGTQFRVWANKVLKDYLVKGYALNEKKLKDQTSRIKELEKTLDIFSKVTESYQLKQDEFAGIIKVVKDYTYALDVLDKYDNQTLTISRYE